MSDGSKLKQNWYSSLNDAETYFRRLLTSSGSDWRRLSVADSSKKGKAKATSVPEVSDVIVHRNLKKSGGEDVYRLVLEVPTTEDEVVNLEPWKAVLMTPELRQEWDPAVEDAHLLENFDHSTRISKTNFSLGWPANPRDAVTISRSFSDPTTVLDISTSLPRSVDEPAYLRPSPPFVRSHVHLFAWCIQHLQSQQKLRISCFWQHDFKAMWGLGSSSATLVQQLSTMVLSLFKTVLKRGGRVPKLAGYGNGVSIERVRFQMDREALTIDYSIIPDDDHSEQQDLDVIREQRRLTRSIECLLPSLEGWEVQISLKASSEEVEQLPWSAHAIKTNSNPAVPSAADYILLRFTHAALLDDHSVLKVKVVIEASGGTRGLRLNGLPKRVHDSEQRDPSSQRIPQQILQDVASAVDLSVRTASSVSTSGSSISSTSSLQTLMKPAVERSALAEKSLLSRVRRNYIYFSSLLQEPEAKWRRTTEGRGVAITQLDSIDPTLIVYRAEATFVGVGLWDLYSAVVSPGARVYWDKQFEDGVLLEDVNELSELWYFKSKPAWPVHGRDSVVLKTVYKSPNVIHVFAFSADDPNLFSNIPPVDPNTIRTQVDLQGWSIEALSPTTTSLTLLEQSDPKGWTNKTSLPQNMISTLAGIGEFAIKCGGPPLVTRLTGAKANTVRYDHEKGSFRVEYEASARRRTASSDLDTQDDSSRPSIECEIRCDVDTWASSLDIVVDPPPQTMTCLRRHRLSSDGGGLWLTLTHDCVFVDDERLLVLIRRAPGKEKGLVMVNGAKITVDVEEIPEAELKALSKQKRVKPPRVPLDQPPVVGNVRKRRAEWSDEGAADGQEEQKGSTSSAWASAPRISSPLTRLFSYAVDQATTTTQQYVAAITPANSSGPSAPSATKFPFQHALETLAWTQEFHKSPTCHSSSPTDGWTLLNANEKGVAVLRKVVPEISPIIPVHKGSKVIEGASAEELASIISSDSCRKIWDDRFDSSRTLESYGASCRTQFLTAKGGFPFRDRGFYLANLVARTQPPSPNQPSLSRRNTNDIADQTKSVNAIFVVSASFSPESITPLFAASKYNFYNLPIGRVYLDAWILETLDPYSTENYAIPSTRCTRLVALDYAGSIPAAVNSMINTGLPRAILAVESCFKAMSSSLPVTRLPASCVALAGKKGEDRLATASWKLKTRDEERLLLDESYFTDSKVYKTSLLVTMQPKTTAGQSVLEKGERSKSPQSANGMSSSLSTPNASSPGHEGSTATTPRLPSRPFSPARPTSPRVREASEATVTGPGTRSRSSSASSNVDMAASIETLRAVRSPPDTPFYTMPGTISIPKSLGSPGESLVRPFRQRAASSTEGGRFVHAGYHGQYATSPGGSTSVSSSPAAQSPVRGRAVSSVFTGKGEIKPLKDFILGEVVIDTRLYPQGYTVLVTSRFPKPPKKSDDEEVSVKERIKELCLEVDGKDKGKGREVPGKEVFLKLGSLKVDPSLTTAKPTSSLRPPSPISKSASLDSSKSTDSNATMIVELPKPAEEPNEPLPIAYTIYTMPSSPLHSSSLNPEGGTTRHLLRMTLPTAQYWSSTVRDPLTGQVRQGPKKPGWLKVLEGTLEVEESDAKEGSIAAVKKRVRGFVVDVEVRPTAAEGMKGGDKDKKRKSVRKVSVNGTTVPVIGERESLSSLGRDELLNEQVEKMGILSRVPNETEALPEELIHPVAIAEDLLDPAVWGGISGSAGSTNSASLISKALDATSPDSAVSAGANDKNGQPGGNSAGEVTPGSAVGGLGSSITSPSGNTSSSTSSGIWALWSSYRFGFATASSDNKARGAADDESPQKLAGETLEDLAQGDKSGSTAPLEKAKEPSPEQQAEQQVLPPRRATLQQQYPLSTLLAVALIAFLIGSLLRSLLSPADFVYVAEADEADKVKLSGGDGWREMKRLFELKYILGGWDLQVAAIRRHPL